MELPACKSHTFETLYDDAIALFCRGGDFVYCPIGGYKAVTQPGRCVRKV
jgi:hypothetical protein